VSTLIFTEAGIAGAWVIKPSFHEDERGRFFRAWCSREFEEHGIPFTPVQANTGFSVRKGTIRAMHFQVEPALEAKLVRCTRGAVFDVALDRLSRRSRHCLLWPLWRLGLHVDRRKLQERRIGRPKSLIAGRERGLDFVALPFCKECERYVMSQVTIPPLREGSSPGQEDQAIRVSQADEVLLEPRNATTGPSRKIALLNHLGGGNLGDDATLAAVMQNIKRRWPGSQMYGFTMNPADTEGRHGIPSYPIRAQTWSLGNAAETPELSFKTKTKAGLQKYRSLFWLLKAINAVAIRAPRTAWRELRFLAKSYGTIRSFDFLVVSGGGQLLDSWGGPWRFPYTLFKWVALARCAGVKCYFLNVGAGPLTHRLSKWFVKRALFSAGYVSFRDAHSQALLQKVGFSGKSQVVADCVYALDVPGVVSPPVLSRGKAIVGLSPMAYCDPRVYYKKTQGVYENFIQTLANFGYWLSENDYRLALFSTDICFDAQTIEDLKTALTAGNGKVPPDKVRHSPVKTIDGLLALIASLDFIVTCRFHGVIFAHLLNKPVLALSHHPKVTSLMNDLGLSRYCVDIHTCDAASLAEAFRSLVQNGSEIKSRMNEKSALYKGGLTLQFDDLFGKVARS